jgi:hypothetical protein
MHEILQMQVLQLGKPVLLHAALPVLVGHDVPQGQGLLDVVNALRLFDGFPVLLRHLNLGKQVDRVQDLLHNAEQVPLLV